jgi:hypothetical protein
VELLAGTLDEDHFLSGPMNRGDLCNAYLSAGLKRLAAGNRAGAKELFEKTVELWVIDFVPYDMSYLLLGQMEMEKAEKEGKHWPPWIPRKP